MKFKNLLSAPLKGRFVDVPQGSIGHLVDVDEILIEAGGNVDRVQLTQSQLFEEWYVTLETKTKEDGLITPADASLAGQLNKFVAMSLMQKGVRRASWRDVKIGIQSLFTGGDATACIRRLTVIAMEDIGNGDPQAAALALLILHSKEVHASFGKMTAAFIAGRILTYAWKSRDLCDFNVWAWHTEGVFEYCRAELRPKNLTQIMDIILDPEQPLAERVMAYALLWPVKQIGGMKGKGPSTRMEVYQKLEVPPCVAYGAEVCYAKSGDFLGLASPFATLMTHDVKKGSDLWTGSSKRRKDGLLLAALDKHTYQGKAAIKRWLKHEPIKDWYDAHPHVDRVASIMRAEFYVSASVLEPRALYPQCWDLYYSILEQKALGTGHASLDETLELFNLAEKELPVLDEMRAK